LVIQSTVSRSADSQTADLLITSIGAASPQAASVLSQALELPVETVVDALYRAPARLLSGLSGADAARLAEMITILGVEVAVIPAGETPPRRPTLDLAGELLDPARADEVGRVLGRFLGMDPLAALDLLLTPPGVILGSVTEATVSALEAALPAGATRLTASRPDQARFALFASDLSPLQIGILRPHLPVGALLAPGGAATVFDLERGEADALWRRLKAPERVRVVNQAFLRFSLDLVAAPEDAAVALEALAGVPPEDYALLRSALPVTVEAAIPFDDLSARMAAYAAAGFTVRAEMETFSHVSLDILSARPETLAAAGLPAPAPLSTAPMPRPRASLLRHRLEAAGAEVLFAEAGR
jgi:hypothetical protein